jgi:DNA (cytosine-5)-methyltransferase 1
MLMRRVVSLFSGAGGLDYGFEAAGYRTVLAVDADHDCCDALRNSRAWRVHEADVTQVRSDTLLQLAGLRKKEIDVLIGGPPCQPFSKSGFWRTDGARRLADPRAQTLGAFMRIVEDTLPKAFLLENVQGINYSELDEGFSLLLRYIDRINKRTGTRYHASYTVLNAADYGVPQIRHRLFLVAHRDGGSFVFPTPTHGSTLAYRTAWDALGDVAPDDDELLTPTGKWARLLPSIPEGQNYLWHTARGGGLPLFGWRCRYWTFLLKLAKDQPSWTIQANPGPSCGPFHWENRRLAIRELARLQSFPDSARFSGSTWAQRQQVGNAVPSLLAEALAREVAVQFFGARRSPTLPKLLLPSRGAPPRKQRRAPVPAEYYRFIGGHREHPGAGRGPQPSRWRAAWRSVVG